jgi:hypothetical protein
VSSIGAIAVAPSDANVIWAGTGESMIRSHISMGWGMFRSTDAGRSWQRAGLEATGRIARISVDPRDANVAVVAALGHAYTPQQERGISHDRRRENWRRARQRQFRRRDVCIDPNDPDHPYATWNSRFTPVTSAAAQRHLTSHDAAPRDAPAGNGFPRILRQGRPMSPRHLNRARADRDGKGFRGRQCPPTPACPAIRRRRCALAPR